MALQGAVGAFVGGTAGKAARRIAPKTTDKIVEGIVEPEARDLAAVQAVADWTLNPNRSDKKYESVLKKQADELAKQQEAQQTAEGQEQADVEAATQQEADLTEEGRQETIAADEEARRAQTEEARSERSQQKAVATAFANEYDNLTPTGDQKPHMKLSYVLNGLEEQGGIQTTDEALGLAGAKQRDVVNLINRAVQGLRTQEETATIDGANENIYEAAKAWEQTNDPAVKEQLMGFIDAEKAKMANIVASNNRKVLLANPKAVATAIEASAELENAQNQKQAIEENGNLDPSLKENMLRSIQERTNAAYDKGQAARSEIEKSAASAQENVTDDSKFLQELYNEEFADNDKKTDAIIQGFTGLGFVEDLDNKVTDETLAEGRQVIANEDGTKEFGKTFSGVFGTPAEARQAVSQAKQEAKAKGYKVDYTITDANPERAGGEQVVEIETFAPRQEGLIDGVNKLKTQQEQELDPDQGLDQEIEAEEGQVVEAPKPGEKKFDEAAGINRTVPTPEQLAEPTKEVVESRGGQYIETLPDGRERYNITPAEFPRVENALKGRNHDIEYNKDTHLAYVTPGGYEFSLEEQSPTERYNELLTKANNEGLNEQEAIEFSRLPSLMQAESSEKSAAERAQRKYNKEGPPAPLEQLIDISGGRARGYELSIDEDGRAHRPDGKFANGQEKEVARVRELPLEDEDGATFNLDGSVYEDGGLVVPIASKNMKASELTPQAIENFKQKYAEYMGPASKVGIYKFPNQDQVSIDLNVIAPASKRDEALAIGTRLGQESLFDLDTFENIKTGQTGASPKTPTAAQAKNISNQLADVELSVTEDFRTPTLQEAIQARQDIRGIESKGRRTTKEATPEQLAEIEAGRERTGVIQEATPALGDEASEAAFDRTKVEGPRIQNIIDDLGKQPKLTDATIAEYNNGDLSNNDFIKRIAKVVLANVPRGDKELEGFALEKLVEQVDKGNFKDKNLSQVFTKAKSIGRASKTDQRKAYGENVRAQRIRNVARRAEDAFFAENGFEPGNVELADYINDNVSKYKLEDVTPEQIENSKFEEVASGVELAGIQGAAREIGQTRAAKEAGFDQLTDAVLPSDLVSRVDDAVSDILAARPIVESEGKGRTDEAVTAIKKAGTRLDKTVGVAISDLIPASLLKNNFAEISEILNLNETNWDNLSRAQKQDVKRKVVKGLAKEAEDRLGKTQTPSQESEFSIEEGSATRVTDTGAKATRQVNSHGQNSKVTKREIADSIRETDFDNDWVQWSPGKLNPNSDKARRMSPSRVAELIKQPAEIAKFAEKKGLKLRPDAYNKGLYHIYKPGKPGSPNVEASVKEFNALSRANKKYIDDVTQRLQKAWPGIKIASTPEAYAKAVAGLGVPSSQIKGAYLVGDNTVVINPNLATYDTPIHEFGHIWAKQLMRSNPELWKKGVELLKGSEFMRAVDSIPTYQQYRKDGNLAKFYEEVMANAIGKHGANLFTQKTKQNAWNKWMKDVGSWIKNKLGIASEKPYDQLTLNDWLDTAVHGVFTGGTPVQGKGSEFSFSRGIKAFAKGFKKEVFQTRDEKAEIKRIQGIFNRMNSHLNALGVRVCEKQQNSKYGY